MQSYKFFEFKIFKIIFYKFLKIENFYFKSKRIKIFYFISTIQIMRDPETGKSKGFGFVSYDNFESSD